MRRSLITAAAICSLSVGQAALAHVFAPALLELRATTDSHFAVRWKQPAMRSMGTSLQPVLPAGCDGVGRPSVKQEGTGTVATWEISCPGGLAGRTISVDGLAPSRTSALLRLELGAGHTLQHVLTGAAPSFTVPAEQGPLGVVLQYAELGVRHILGGWDHLAFVLGLIVLVGGGRRLLATVTAFTVGHSVTLGLAVLGVVHVPQPPVESAIALSIFVLAVELERTQRTDATAFATRPWTMAFAFGLLHGLGFAGALAEVGLPAGEIPLALFSFNVGIELGQLVFVGCVLAGWAALRALPVAWPRALRLVPAYAIGSLAVFWFLQRILPAARALGLS